MPQNSIYYAVGRLSVLGQNALDGARLERLMQAPTAAEARRALSEMGWKEDDDYARMAESHVEQACRTLRKLATDEKILDCFLLRYDVNNLKMLIKARCLGVEAQTLSPCGVYALDRLRHDVAEHRYADLAPELQAALDELEKRLAVAVDPLDVDVSLDKALYETIFAWLPDKARAERRYFTARADIVNLTIALRVLRMGKDAAFFSQLLLPCGSVGKGAWLKAFAQPEKLPLLVNKYGVKVSGAAIAARQQAAAKTDDVGSCILVLGTDLPLSSRQLGRVVRRCGVGLARVDGARGLADLSDRQRGTPGVAARALDHHHARPVRDRVAHGGQVDLARAGQLDLRIADAHLRQRAVARPGDADDLVHRVVGHADRREQLIAGPQQAEQADGQRVRAGHELRPHQRVLRAEGLREHALERVAPDVVIAVSGRGLKVLHAHALRLHGREHALKVLRFDALQLRKPPGAVLLRPIDQRPEPLLLRIRPLAHGCISFNSSKSARTRATKASSSSCAEA